MSFNVRRIIYLFSFFYLLFCSGCYALECDYSTRNNMYVFKLQTDVYNDRSSVSLKDSGGNVSLYRIYDGDKENIRMIMSSARMSLLLGSKVSVCFYNYGSYYMLYNMELYN